jgi:putative peptidoglycan lipid II flippase
VSGGGPARILPPGLPAGPRQHRSLGRTTLLLTPLQLVLRLTEAAFPLCLAAWFGSSARTDVYVFAATVFTLAGALLFAAYRDSALIPILTEVRLRRPAELPRVRGALVVYTALAAAAFAVLMGALAAAWFQLRYPAALRPLALALILPLCLHLVFLALSFLLVALLHAEHRFVAAAVAFAAGKGGTLLLLALVEGRGGVVGIPWAQAGGELAALVLLALLARGSGLPIRLTTSRPRPVRRFAALTLSQVGGHAITRLNPLVDQLFAGTLAVAGASTLLKLAGDASLAPTSLLQATLLPVLLSHLSEDITRRDRERFRATVRRSLAVVLPLLVLAAAGMIALRRPLLELLYLRGAMTPAQIDQMTPVFLGHLLGLPGFGALLLLARAHVAAGNTRLLLPLGALNATLNIALNAALMPLLGLPGIALATSATSTTIALVFWLRLRPLLQRG